MLTYILFFIGFVLLIKGADLLIDGASSIAKVLKVPDLFIGLTVVAFGTSCPELFVNIFASAKGNTEIAIGNILGSNIFNILLILGVSSIIYPLKVTKNTVSKEIPLTLLAAVCLGVMANDHLIDHNNFSALTRTDGIILLLFFSIFLFYAFSIPNKQQQAEETIPDGKKFTLLKSIIFIILGLALLTIGARWTVNGAIKLALTLGVSQSLIGLTIVAVGTSLPELVTSVVAAYKKNTDIAVGNILGSNIFNIFFILGISSLIRPLSFQMKNNTDILVTTGSSLLLFIFMFSGKKRVLDRWEGVLLVLIYAGYLAILIAQR